MEWTRGWSPLNLLYGLKFLENVFSSSAISAFNLIIQETLSKHHDTTFALHSQLATSIMILGVKLKPRILPVFPECIVGPRSYKYNLIDDFSKPYRWPRSIHLGQGTSAKGQLKIIVKIIVKINVVAFSHRVHCLRKIRTCEWISMRHCLFRLKWGT